MEIVKIDLNKNSYNIYIDENILNKLEDYLDKDTTYILLTDKNVNKLYEKHINFLSENYNIFKYVINPGEESKDIDNFNLILNFMLEKNLTRNSKLIALGGGVVGDLGGFCASVYMRGISYIQIPTTLLSQVDSSVGGKTAINLPSAKNIVGSFYQPEKVLIDTNVIKTLPYRELLSGIGEVIKYGIISDYDFFLYLKKNIDKLMNKEEDILKYVIKRCCEIKAWIVSKDEKESGLRKILNFGHTIAHSLEGISRYEKYTHGEAVIIGMYYESKLSLSLGLIDIDYYKEIKIFLESLGLDLSISQYKKKDLINIMKKDKKNINNKISFILPIEKSKVKEYLLNEEEIKF